MGRFKKFLDKLTKANQETLGSGRLDCCKLNKDGKFVKKDIKFDKENKSTKS